MRKENEISACVRKTVSDYFRHLDGEKPCAVYEAVLVSVEKPLIEVVLHQAGGNQTKAAEILGLNRNTLRKKMHLYDIK
jgi:Fis family transcriptional regulator, factor for inversion stimulation protein